MSHTKRKGDAHGEEPPKKVLPNSSWVSPAGGGTQRAFPSAYQHGGPKAGRFPPGFTPKKLCRFFDSPGGCHAADACSFAHGEAELHPETIASGGGNDLSSQAAFPLNPFDEADAAAAGNDDPDPLASLLLEQAAAAGFAEADIDAAFNMEMDAMFGGDQVLEEIAAQEFVAQEWPELQESDGQQDGHEEQDREENVEQEDPGEPELCHSALIGPRSFAPAVQPPLKICSRWLQHPSLCRQGDLCVDAHGFAEIEESGWSAAAKAAMASMSARPSSNPSRRPMPPPVLPAPPGGIRPIARMALGVGSGKGKGFANQTHVGPVGPVGKGKGGAMAAALPTQYGRPPMIPPVGGGKGEGAPLMLPPEGGRFASQGKGAGFMPTKLCTYWIKDPHSCNKGDQCSFAHGVCELRPDAVASCTVSRFLHSGFRPTRICNFFVQGGCHRGPQCTFAHSEEELTQ